MSKEENIAQQIVPLSCDIIVYRALKNQWVNEDTSSILFDAFMLRHPPKADKVEDGVSLVFTAEKCLKILKRSKYAASLTLRQIQDVSKAEGLDLFVIQNKPSHAEIRGLPCPILEPDKLQRVAGLLARQCKLHPLN
jgi:cytochrome P450